MPFRLLNSFKEYRLLRVKNNHGKRMADIVTIAEAAAALDVSPERIRQLCRAGRVEGAKLSGKVWLIPMPIRVIPPAPSKQQKGKLPVMERGELPPFLKQRLPKQRTESSEGE